MDSQTGAGQTGSKKNKGGSRKNKSRKYGRNKEKCARYRLLIGKPNGPGQPGNKAGRNKG